MKIWQLEEVIELSQTPFFELISKAMEVHKANHNANEVEIATLCSIKTSLLLKYL